MSAATLVDPGGFMCFVFPGANEEEIDLQSAFRDSWELATVDRWFCGKLD